MTTKFVPTLLVLMAVSPSVALPAAEGVRVLVNDFENVGCGSKWVIVGVHGHNLKAEIVEIPEAGHDGKGCARVTVGAGSALVIRREFGKGFVRNGDKECLILPGLPSKLGLWVKGNRSPTKLTARVSKALLDFGALEFEGWRYLEKEIPAIEASPVRLREIRFDASKAAEVAQPQILIDDLTLTTQGTQGTQAAPLFIDFKRLRVNTELSAGDSFVTRLRLQNLLPERLRVQRRRRRHVRQQSQRHDLLRAPGLLGGR